MSEELKLLPCPFCGGKAQARPPGFSNKHVTCVDCHSHALSVTMWNHRDTTAVQREREECAKLAEAEYEDGDWLDRDHAGRAIAAAIRRRGE